MKPIRTLNSVSRPTASGSKRIRMSVTPLHRSSPATPSAASSSSGSSTLNGSAHSTSANGAAAEPSTDVERAEPLTDVEHAEPLIDVEVPVAQHEEDLPSGGVKSTNIRSEVSYFFFVRSRYCTKFS